MLLLDGNLKISECITRVYGTDYRLRGTSFQKVGEKEKMLRMLREEKVLYVHPVGKTPSLDYCYEAVDIAMKNNCYVRMEWNVSHSGWYKQLNQCG